MAATLRRLGWTLLDRSLPYLKSHRRFYFMRTKDGLGVPGVSFYSITNSAQVYYLGLGLCRTHSWFNGRVWGGCSLQYSKVRETGPHYACLHGQQANFCIFKYDDDRSQTLPIFRASLRWLVPRDVTMIWVQPTKALQCWVFGPNCSVH